MSDLYGKQHRNLQHEFGREQLADRVSEAIVTDMITDEHSAFISSRDFFFLSTLDHRGFPTCSHKGGEIGFVKVLDDKTLMFPSLDGNGMYLSMGNIDQHQQVGLLFIDFETPHRVRVHGHAKLSRDPADLGHFREAELVVKVTIAEIFQNCPRYIHRYQRVTPSRYIPSSQCPTPIATWKRLDVVQDVISDVEREKVSQSGGEIDFDTYVKLLGEGKA
ncbi:pyridoxamine 5'-phosphate oxidase-like protein [Methylophaga frappieri]|uniref:Pyridoxamine 5'-phosphate oxidase-like protein n=1 Tax=Methylophaga frappieri (strain ATCC BAA-2434 / DSM 25690 / JAM7) TaxID=754477 RepID=I1YES8_METFJ|nr:pyridoxamine 5'-phosphate oxidase family protein [Methylophaga frappieri]AFJ01421.1 pyridoxamine 5'-phosphate oxidase-like protein [Methylophaga frappieri]